MQRQVLRFSWDAEKILYSGNSVPIKRNGLFSVLPLGYVKLLDARADSLGQVSPEDRKREFTSQNVWRRMAIVAAGPLPISSGYRRRRAVYLRIRNPVARCREVPVNTASPGKRFGGGGETVVISMHAHP